MEVVFCWQSLFWAQAQQLSYKVYDDEVQDDVGKNEVCEGSLGADGFELAPVLWVYLRTKTTKVFDGSSIPQGTWAVQSIFLKSDCCLPTNCCSSLFNQT